MEINGRTALVTGANRGLGRHLAEQLRTASSRARPTCPRLPRASG